VADRLLDPVHPVRSERLLRRHPRTVQVEHHDLVAPSASRKIT
jgi:hypothetical protein